MSGGGSSQKVKVPKEQKRLWNLAYGAGKDIWRMARSGQGLWDVPSYNLPDASMLAPSGDWWENLDPTIRQGIAKPYMDMANQMGEQFGGAGMMGSPMTGPSGAFGGALGDAMGQWGGQMAQTGWGMMSPSYAQDYQSQLGQNQNMWQQQIASQQAPWTMLPSYLGQGNAAAPPTTVSQNSNPLMGAMGGGMMGGMLASGIGSGLGLAAGAANPYMWPLVGLGALGGAFS